MPLYTCHSPPDLIDADQRQRIAEAITEIHCTLTTAPPTFVHVQFRDRNPGPEEPLVSLSGGIRAGRPESVTRNLVDRISEAVSAITGVDRDRMTMRTVETPASWILEGGRVMPEPGQEAAWADSA